MPDSSSVDLLLLRHGIAEQRVDGLDHPDRALTDRGRLRTRAVVCQLRRLGVEADRLLSSPCRRALQTAEEAVQAGLAPSLQIAEDLAPGGDPWSVVQGVKGRCLLVGHEPDLGDLASALIGARPGGVRLRKAGFCHLRWCADLRDPRGMADLQALLRPRLLFPRSV